MPFIEILKESRGFNESVNNIEQNLVYVIANEDFDLDAGGDATYGEFFTPNDDVGLVNFISATFPSFRTFRTLDGVDVVLVLLDYEADQLQDEAWKVKLRYGIPEDQSQGSGSYVQFGFSIGNETEHISRSLEVKDATGRTGSTLLPPENHGMIGITRNSIEGIDIAARGLKFNITGYFSPQIWDTSFLALFRNLATCYNNASFYGFTAGEVLFLGCDGQGDAYRLIPIKFDFLAKKNAVSLPMPPFPNLTALAHDVVDFLYAAETSNDFQIRAPMYRYVHRVYDPANFALLGI